MSTTRAGITTEYTYDAEGRTIATLRNGVMISSNAYDVAGRLISSTDAMGNTTTYAETRNASNETVKTTTYPNGTTRIETYFQDGQLKSVTGTAVHGVRYEYGVEQDDGVYRRYTKEIKLNTDGSDSLEWTKTYFDMIDRPYKTVYADGSYSQSFYNNKGQLWKQRDPDGIVTLFAYNDRGELETTAIDMDHNDTIDYAGSDRIVRSQNSVTNIAVIVRLRTTTTEWTTNGSSATLTTSIVDTSASGLQRWQIAYGLTNSTTTTYDRANARTTTKATAPDGSFTVSISDTGRVSSVTRYDAGSNQLAAVSYQYDAHGRLVTATDARTGDTTYTYNAADQRLSVSTGGQTTSWQYDSMGRVTTNTLPDNGIVVTEYHDTGEIKKTYGARTYPVEYTYDYAGRLKTLKTWKDFAGNTGAATTTWNYDSQRGFLTSKVYDDSSSVTYSNSAAGRLARRTWARGVATDYPYNNAGELSAIDYSDSTPDVSIAYDRRGRRTSVTNGADVCTYTYNNAGRLLTETFPVAAVTVTNTYDSLLRRTSVNSGTGVPPVSYSYDAASRLSTVAQASLLVSYSYLANSALASNITFRTGTITRMRTTKTYDALNRLLRVDNVIPSESRNLSFAYDYNAANQRTKRTEEDGSYWEYGYDALGQVTSGHRKWSDNSSVNGQQYDYAYDDIGNRATNHTNGRESTYTANSLNQYTQRTVPGYLWELGSATNAATVTVNNQPTSRHGGTLRKNSP